MSSVKEADEIINRHLMSMLLELAEKGFGPLGGIAFVAGEGKQTSDLDYNIAVVATENMFPHAPNTSDAQSQELLAFAAAMIGDHLRSL